MARLGRRRRRPSSEHVLLTIHPLAAEILRSIRARKGADTMPLRVIILTHILGAIRKHHRALSVHNTHRPLPAVRRTSICPDERAVAVLIIRLPLTIVAIAIGKGQRARNV